MKKLLLVLGILLFAVNAGAMCIVKVTWTPSPNAAREILMLNGTEQDCDTPGYCEFAVQGLDDQEIVARSFNSQGNYVDSDPYTLSEEDLPSPAVIIRVDTLCTD